MSRNLPVVIVVLFVLLVVSPFVAIFVPHPNVWQLVPPVTNRILYGVWTNPHVSGAQLEAFRSDLLARLNGHEDAVKAAAQRDLLLVQLEDERRLRSAADLKVLELEEKLRVVTVTRRITVTTTPRGIPTRINRNSALPSGQ
jgi:hypothetical protein